MRLRPGLAAALLASSVLAQETPDPPQPKPAFAGQTEAPAPKQKSRYRVTIVTDQLAAPWAIAFLPDGNFLVTESAGRLRTITPTGAVSEPIAGVPPVKVVAAQGFHDVALDPDFATNRYLYFSYFAPPRGEPAKRWPLEHFYNEVWEKSVAERRVLDLGEERVGRAKLSADNRRLEDVEVLIDGRACS
jgi:glucose/arabinose dehydrogenase